MEEQQKPYSNDMSHRILHLKVIKEFKDRLPLKFDDGALEKKDDDGKFDAIWQEIMNIVQQRGLYHEKGSMANTNDFKFKNYFRWKGQMMRKFNAVEQNEHCGAKFNVSDRFIITDILEREIPKQSKRQQQNKRKRGNDEDEEVIDAQRNRSNANGDSMDTSDANSGSAGHGTSSFPNAAVCNQTSSTQQNIPLTSGGANPGALLSIIKQQREMIDLLINQMPQSN